eukprot:CAMPEP_0114328810 /NCGR_PEP_ID=MMETSP0101-20121206/649_1 /TAXON_ID=38822 ORGANISM="Pteridomonas danica, Strain PT" /NCGR_SAMPLE_ID=MMETSP0101 /ASSEMBLY_ACC=CAM_ASM_000211 /LENGTH=175 /DNA_ID=CAMNT_0001458245 /DNA_START=603 /DNA_END=1130 /DNA_ORIENTATION=+
MTGESVMVTVAKGLEAPIKLLFPRIVSPNINEEVIKEASAEVTLKIIKPIITNFNGQKIEFSMLGLGDIVIPGFLIALLLRFDAENANAPPKHGAHGSFDKPYFRSNLLAYFLGLSFTISMMVFFDAAQPALLYLVPACLGTALITAYVRKEIEVLFKYDENRTGIEVVADKKIQ